MREPRDPGAPGERGRRVPERHQSRPHPEDIADLVKALRRQTKHGPARLAGDLQWLHSVTLAPATVHRILVKRGLHRLRDPDPPTGEQRREVIRYEHDQVGDPVNVHIKKARTHPTLVDGRRSRPPAPGTRPAQGRFGKPQLPI